MRNRESEEMYLETILLLSKRQAKVRSIDVVEELGYAKSSVSRGVNLLLMRGFIDIDKNGEIHLTESGYKKAHGIYERHEVLKKVLLKLGASESLAEQDACKMEHVISDETLALFKNFIG